MAKSVTKKLGAVIDKLHAFDMRIASDERVLKSLKAKRATQEALLLRMLNKADLEKAAGRKAQASISRRPIPTIKDQVAFQKYVRANRAFDLYQNRVASRAYFARIEEGEKVPGIDIFEKVSVSIRKRG